MSDGGSRQAGASGHQRSATRSIQTKRFDEITDADAQLEGGDGAEDLRMVLRGHYPRIEDGSGADVVHFHVDRSGDHPTAR